MRWKKTLQLVDVHCEGEIGKVITGGVLDIPGKTMLDKMNYINEVDDSLRRLVVLEPRGCLQMSVNLLLPPARPEAQAGFIVLQARLTRCRAVTVFASSRRCSNSASCRWRSQARPWYWILQPVWSPRVRNVRVVAV